MNARICGRRLGRQCNLSIRQFSSSTTLLSSKIKKPIRAYRYAIDTHGQLFLHDTVPKNLTSCFKNKEFLDFFFTRVRPNDTKLTTNQAKDQAILEILKDEEWTETNEFFSSEEILQLGALQGYHWFSPCQGELNLIRSADSPIVFRELTKEGKLIWAGTLEETFQPSLLKVDAETGYVYHPSPEPILKSLRIRVENDDHPYGAYSLLSSALVLQCLADGLEIDPDQFPQGKGGSIEWNGARYPMGIIQDGVDVAKNRRHRVDDRA